MKNTKKQKRAKSDNLYNKKKDELILKYINNLENKLEKYRLQSLRKQTKISQKKSNPFEIVLFLDMLKKKRERERNDVFGDTVKKRKFYKLKQTHSKSDLPNLVITKSAHKNLTLKNTNFSTKTKKEDIVKVSKNLPLKTDLQHEIAEDEEEEKKKNSIKLERKIKIRTVVDSLDLNQKKLLKTTNQKNVIPFKFMNNKIKSHLNNLRKKKKFEIQNQPIFFSKKIVEDTIGKDLEDDKCLIEIDKELNDLMYKTNKSKNSFNFGVEISNGVKLIKPSKIRFFTPHGNKDTILSTFVKEPVQSKVVKLFDKEMILNLKKRFQSVVLVISSTNYIQKKTRESLKNKQKICHNFYKNSFLDTYKKITFKLKGEMIGIFKLLDKMTLLVVFNKNGNSKYKTTYNNYTVR